MNTNPFARRTVGLAILCLAGGSLISAQNIISWVASTGSDANNCTRPAPCRTFSTAVAQTVAGGFVHVVDSADYGYFAITKAITIDGAGAAAVVNGFGQQSAIYLNLQNSDVVTLRNLSIYPDSGSPTDQVTHFGILTNLAGNSSINVENVDVITAGSKTIGIELANSPLAGSSAKTRAHLRNVRTEGGYAGIWAFDPVATLDRVAVTGAQYGLIVQCPSAAIRDSLFHDNAQVGVQSYGAVYSGMFMIERSEISQNNTGLLAGSGSTFRLSDTVITGNVVGLGAGQGTVITFRTNMIAGNGTDGSTPFSTSLK